MAKELPFFKFEISEWMFGRIQKQPEDIQGMFINLCCKYWHKLGEYEYESACLDFDKERLDKLIQAKIIGVDQGYLFIKFMDIQFDECEQSSNKQRIKGLKSAAVRALRKQQISTTVEQRLTTVQPNPTEEKRREEKRKEESDKSKILIFGNQSDKFFTVNSKYINEPRYKVYETGFKEFAEGPMMGMWFKKDFLINMFWENWNGKMFNDISHLNNVMININNPKKNG